MDFRLVSPPDIAWSTWSRGQPVARTAQGGKVVVQTPLCPCRMSLAGAGMYRVELALRPDLPAHAAFADWLSDVEDSAQAAPALAEWRGARRRSTTAYNNSVRLMAFSDTLAFDASGNLSADLMAARGCACILELQGGWSGEARWGLRWKIVQIKFAEECALPTAPQVDDDEDITTTTTGGVGCGGGGGFAFVED